MSVLKLSKNDIIRNKDKEEKIKLKRSDLSLDSARISCWEQANRQSLDVINNYNNRINNGEWLSNEDRANYRTALDSYIETSNLLRGINKTFGKGYSDEDEQQWADSITSMNKAYDSTDKYYSQWIDEKDYKGERDGWFQSSNLFDDGYQFGDVIGTIAGSATDLVENLGAGIIGMGEATLDALVTLGPYFAQGQYYANGGGYNLHADKMFDQSNKAAKDWANDFVKKDLYDEQEVADLIVSGLLPVEAFTGINSETDSVFGKKSDGLFQSAGQLAGTIGLQALGVPWWLTTGATALGGESESALNQGATLDQAALSGVISAGAEILTEKIASGISFGGKTLEDFLPKITANISNKVVRKLVDLGIDVVGEGGEEIISGVMSAIGQKMTYASDKEISELFSSEEALDSFIGGAVLGFGGGVIGNVGQTISENKQAHEIYGTGAELVTEALEIDPQNAYAQKMQAKLDKGNSLSGGQINRIVEANENALVSQDKGKIKSAVEEQLSKYGETGDIKKIAEVITKLRSGEKLSKAESEILVNSKSGRRVSTEMNPDVINAGTHTTSWVEDIGTERIGSDVYNRSGEKSSFQTIGKIPIHLLPHDEEKRIEGGGVHSAEKTNLRVVIDSNSNATNSQTVAQNKTAGKPEEKERRVESIGEGEASREHIAEFSQKYGEQAQAAIDAYEDGQDVVEYESGYDRAFEKAKSGLDFSYIESSEDTAYLTEAQKKTAYEAGVKYADSVARQQAENITTQTAENTVRRKGAVKGEGVKIADLRKAFNDTQNRAYKVLSRIAEATGIDIVLYKSEVDANGNYRGAQGKFKWSNDKIYIDLNAGLNNVKDTGSLANYTMLRTFSHEFSHFIEKHDPMMYNELRRTVFSELTARGSNVEALIAAKQGDMDIDNASREVVAEALTDILPDSHFVEILAQKNPSALKKISAKLKEFVSNVKSYFASIKPNSAIEAEALKEERDGVVHYVESIIDTFDKAAVSAVENYQNNGGNINATRRTEQHQERGSDQTTSRSDEGTLSSNGDGRGVSQKNEGDSGKDPKVLSLSDKRQRIGDLYFSTDSYIIPKENSVEYNEGKVLDEYGIEWYVVKADKWTIDASAWSYKGRVYFKEGIEENLRGAVGIHEAVHIMRQLGFRPYLDFLDATSEKMNMSSENAVDIIRQMAERYNIDLFNANEEQLNVVYDEINAALYSGYTLFAEDAEYFEFVNEAFYDYEGHIEELSAIHEQFKVERKSKEKEQHQEREEFSLDNRSLLVNALDSVAQNPMESKKLSEYRANIKGLNEQSEKLVELKSELKELSFSKGPRDMARIKELRAEIVKTENRINLYDKRLLNLEATKALRDVITRETQKAYKKAEQKGKEALKVQRERAEAKINETRKQYQEARANNVEGRRKTEVRLKLRKVAKELGALLGRGTKERNVKKGEAEIVRRALEITDMLYMTDEDIVMNGIETAATEAEEKALVRYRELLESLHSTDDDVTSNKQQRKDIRHEITEIRRELSDLLERERKRISEAKAHESINALKDAYKKLQGSKEEYLHLAYRQEVYDMIEALDRDVGATLIKDMSLGQLEEIYKVFAMVKHMVQDSNKMFRNGRKEDIKARVESVFGELSERADNDKDLVSIFKQVKDGVNSFGWNNLRPVDAFRVYGSKHLEDLFWDAIYAQDTYATDVQEAAEVIKKARRENGFAKWNTEKVTSFKTIDGYDFKVTLGEMMSIYAYSKRQQADKHMTEGGFQFAPRAEYTDERGITRRRGEKSHTYRMDGITLGRVINTLTKEQKAYVDAVQMLLTAFGEKGNEVSNALYGIDLFGEESYFPLQVSRDYLNSARIELGGTITTASLSNSGFTKPTVPDANNPIVLRGFDEVVFEHIDKMAKYHAYVIPIDNLRKILDAQGRDSSDQMISLKTHIKAKFGEAGLKYLNQYITDLNGARGPDGVTNPLMKLFSRAKGVSVSANLSVWAQQYFSVIRAWGEVNPRYFIPFMGETFKKNDMKLYNELKRYAPVAVIKEMGGFDVGSNRGLQEYYGYDEARLSAKKAWKKMQDAFGVGAAVMDKLGWMTIWKAVKKEVAAESRYNIGSEEYFKACGKRFTEVVTKTQVYDSVNTRSGYMRSKHDSVKYLTSYMGEPTAIVGSTWTAFIELKRATETKDKAKIAKASGRLAGTLGSIAVATAMTSIAKSLVYAMRDDDEDEAYLEKYAASLAEAFRDDLNLLNYIPIGRDIVSIYEGFTVERPDMALIEEVINSFKKAVDDGCTADEALNIAGAVGNTLGIPIKNVVRDIRAIINVIGDMNDELTADRGLIERALEEGWTGEEASKSEKLYTALINGDNARLKIYKGGYKDDAEYNSAVRKALRDNDPRMREAAEAYIAGDYVTYNAIRDEIVGEGVFDRTLVTDALKAEINYLKQKAKEAKK